MFYFALQLVIAFLIVKFSNPSEVGAWARLRAKSVNKGGASGDLDCILYVLFFC